jgi:FAD-dependent oxidoreductase domain-containing protein 1
LNLGKIRGNDSDYFENWIKPALINRVPSFADLKLVNGWAGPYEYNTLDQNLIIGRHPVYSNMIFTNGSSGHGLQHACAIGNAVQELICYNQYKAIDLKRFGFERILKDQPIKEIDVV